MLLKLEKNYLPHHYSHRLPEKHQLGNSNFFFFFFIVLIELSATSEFPNLGSANNFWWSIETKRSARGPPGVRQGSAQKGRRLQKVTIFFANDYLNIGSTIFSCKLPVNIGNSEGCKCNIRARNFEVLTGHTFISCYMQPRLACSPRALFVQEKFSCVYLAIN